LDPSKDDIYVPTPLQVHGRIGRVRYLAYSCALGLLLAVGLTAGTALAGRSGTAFAIVQLLGLAGALGLGLIVGGRRLNDMGYRRWWAIGTLVPGINVFVGLWLALARGTPGANRFGPAPAPNTRAVVVLAWLLPLLVLAGALACTVLTPQAPSWERTRAEMEQAA